MAIRRIRTTLIVSLALAPLPVATAGEGPRPPDGGGGLSHEQLPHDPVPFFVRANMELELWESAQRLRAQGLLPEPDTRARVDNLIWPLRARSTFSDFDYHGISNYVDLNPAYPNQLLDWNCGTRTYDLGDGYNHAGIDYFLWPFTWRMMDAAVIEIVAAAPGTIIHKIDGYNDRSCQNNYSASWNAVYVQHADGTVAWYGHMKTGSLTGKAVGQPVAAGEFLGLVGSSGFSSGPHLHFELRSSNAVGATIHEPHAGACQATPSRWAVQRPYWSTGINKLATHSAPPNFNTGCPNPGQETPNFSNRFVPGVDTLIVAAYHRDQVAGMPAQYRLKRKGAVVQGWSHAADQNYSASYWYWQPQLPAGAARGAWVFEVETAGRIYRHEYMVGADIILATGFGG